jgi:hypothetical protein
MFVNNMSDIKAASDNFSNNGSGNNVKIASDNAIVKVDKANLFNKENITNHIINNITNNLAITNEDKEKIVNDLLSSDILKDVIIKVIQNLDTGTRKIFIDSTIALASSSKEEYEEKTKLLQNILINKLENLDDNRTHYLTIQAVQAIEKISSDEIRLLALMVHFLWFQYTSDSPQNLVQEKTDKFIKDVGLDDFMKKIWHYNKFCLHSLHSNGLIIKTALNVMTLGGAESIVKLKKWFFCATEEELKTKINKDFILLVQGTQELTELGIFLGTEILKQHQII